MPIYQMWCNKCHEPYEVMMTLKVCDEFDKGKRKKQCPECKKPLKKIICPPKIVRIN
jgi:predicted nucleic acid-binding Zn ribbon protein